MGHPMSARARRHISMGRRIMIAERKIALKNALYFSRGTTGTAPQKRTYVKHTEDFKQTITICKYCKRPF
jgi:hypothetical protein